MHAECACLIVRGLRATPSAAAPEQLRRRLSRQLTPRCVPLEALAFSEGTPFREQVASLARAAVVVSAIGSQARATS